MKRLTRRQAEVLHWMAMGKTTDEICAILGNKSAKNHVLALLRHYNVNNRTGAVVRGMLRGDLDIPALRAAYKE